MTSDITLDGEDGYVTVDSDVLKATGADFMLDCAPRRKNSDGYRRALVHDEEDGLTVNFNGDYPGGVRIIDAYLTEARLTDAHLTEAQLNLRTVPTTSNRLPRKGRLGDIIVLVNDEPNPEVSEGPEASLWLCLGPIITGSGSDVWWRPLSLGDPVAGTLD